MHGQVEKSVVSQTIEIGSLLDAVLSQPIGSPAVREVREVPKPVSKPAQQVVKKPEPPKPVGSPFKKGDLVTHNGVVRTVVWVGLCKFTGEPRVGLRNAGGKALFVHPDSLNQPQTKGRRICAGCGLPIGNRGPGECEKYSE